MPEEQTGRGRGHGQLDQLTQLIGDRVDAAALHDAGFDAAGFDDADFDGTDFGDVPAPTHWPLLPSADTAAEWNQLRGWVEGLKDRFGHLDHNVIPRCWWRYNDHVEALSALRDHERSSFTSTAPATAPADWFRALRDITALLKAWTAELGCGATHTDPPTPLRGDDRAEWERFVTANVARRADAEIDQAAQEPGPPSGDRTEAAHRGLHQGGHHGRDKPPRTATTAVPTPPEAPAAPPTGPSPGRPSRPAAPTGIRNRL